MTTRSRVEAFDRIKAWAILAVILQHASVRAPWLGAAVSFHVPAFLMVSGALYVTRHATVTTIGRRLGRLLGPYVIASLAVVALGIAHMPLARLPFALATGSALQIYYYVPVVAGCILLIWPLSRTPPWVPIALVTACGLYLLAMSFSPSLRLSPRGFWGMRDPFFQFWLGYFLLGWTGAATWAIRAPLRLVVPLVVVGFVGMLWLPGYASGLGRVPYSIGVLGLLARIPVPAMGFLSTATLGLYLWHRPPQILLEPFVRGQPSAVTALFLVGLMGAVAILLTARAILGPVHARRWFGA